MAMILEAKSEAILQDVDEYIICQAYKLLSLYLQYEYRTPDTLEVDELAQRVRIKLWKILEKEQILHPYSYVKRIVYSEFIDMKRQQKRLLALPIEENEQIESPNDPANEFMQQVDNALLLHSIAQMVASLPRRQREAMACLLRDYMDDIAQLQSIFKMYGIDVEAARWPTEKAEKRLLLASLSVARQKLVKRKNGESTDTRPPVKVKRKNSMRPMQNKW
jgi:DNA-directed RNA polymerase specialized sigma24 family protein